MITFYICSKRLHLKRQGLSDTSVVSLTKKIYGFSVHFLQTFVKPLKSILDKWSVNGQ